MLVSDLLGPSASPLQSDSTPVRTLVRSSTLRRVQSGKSPLSTSLKHIVLPLPPLTPWSMTKLLRWPTTRLWTKSRMESFLLRRCAVKSMRKRTSRKSCNNSLLRTKTLSFAKLMKNWKMKTAFVVDWRPSVALRPENSRRSGIWSNSMPIAHATVESVHKRCNSYSKLVSILYSNEFGIGGTLELQASFIVN